MSGRFNIITGVRRSGTSMLMLALRQSGIPTLGFRYSMDDVKVKPEIKKGNPTGFWEIGIITKERGLPSDCGWIGLPGDIIKVMCECLFKSDPKMVNKAIVIMRRPKQIVTSVLKWNKLDLLDMWIINNTMDLIDSIGWLTANKKKFRFAFYEDLIKEPEQELKKLCSFLGRGNAKEGAKWIQPKLNRSERKEYPEIEHLQKVYKLAKAGDVDGIIDYQPVVRDRGAQLLKKYNIKQYAKNNL